MSWSESRPLPGDADFGALGPAVVRSQEPAERPVLSRPVPDLTDTNGSGPATNGSVAGNGNGRPGHHRPTNGTAPEGAPAPARPPARPGEPAFHRVDEHEFDVVAVIDAEGRFLFVSASAERLFGYDISDVVGLDAFGLFDSLSVDPVRSLFRDLVARRRLSVSLELRTVRADGVEIDLDVVAANHLDDPIGGIVVNIRDITERKRLEQAVRDTDRRQSTIIESLADGVLIVDAEGTVVRVNEAFEVMFEAPRVRVIGRRLADLLAPGGASGLEVVDADGEPVEPWRHPVLHSLRGGRRTVGVVLGLRRPGRPPMWVRANAQSMVGADGTITGAVASFSDITAVRQSAAELRREEQFLQVLLDTLDEGIVACDAEGRITVFNPSARRLHGLPDDADPLGTVPSDRGLLRPDGTPMAQREHPLIRAMSGEQLREVELVLASESGDRRKVSVNGQALVDEDGWMLGAVVAMHDVTEQKRNEERLAELALHDPLTGLANRTLLAERLHEAIESLAQASGIEPLDGGPARRGVAVFLLDLDEFKEINDVLGHDVGDDVLIAVARRLSAIVRPSDTVARLGGDEFVVVCDIESGEEEMLRITDRISTALARPYRIDGRTLSVLASVGGVFADNADTDPSRLLSRADDAMYGVKWSRRRQRRSMTD
jgi:diguanylate cyclase (GGDEF)-like protein/PAS domain S-box-containing protein